MSAVRVQHVVGEHVSGLVAEDRSQLVAVEQLDRPRVQQHDGLARADRRGVGERVLPEVEVRDGVEVEAGVAGDVVRPCVAELLGPILSAPAPRFWRSACS